MPEVLAEPDRFLDAPMRQPKIIPFVGYFGQRVQ
jgi:hypothetical protein